MRAPGALARETRRTTTDPESPFHIQASIRDLDGFGGRSLRGFRRRAAVATISTKAGIEERQPRTQEEWAEVRRKAVTLVEAPNLLVMKGRRVSSVYVPARDPSERDSNEAQALMDGNPVLFAALARSLQEAALQALAAIDARNPSDLLEAGGAIDAACEGCHLTYWYSDPSAPQQ